MLTIDNNLGAFFKSMHGTLNHRLLSDLCDLPRAWRDRSRSPHDRGCLV